MEKEQIVKETLEPGNSVSLIARKYNIAPVSFSSGGDMENGASKGIENEENLVPESEYKKLEQRIWNAFSEERLKRTRFSKKRSALLVKKLISQKPLEGIEGTRIAFALGVSRSIFYYKNHLLRTKQSIGEFKEHILQTIKDVCRDRPYWVYRIFIFIEKGDVWKRFIVYFLYL
ncbi:transposase [Leptospira santarosai]|nr:transposase [Leptospira santarosai]MDI7237849.1 transposase [Leptospira santarosai]